jgi:N-acetyl-anhydromuramyl-L-alanine amidase AmpD
MPAVTATRQVITDRLSVMGLRVQTGKDPFFEVAIAADPTLFRADGKPRRTPANFYSSRSEGPLPAERGDAVYLVPPEVLARFAGNERVYYVLATFADTSRKNPEILQLPAEAIPWVTLSKSFTGRWVQRAIGAANRRRGPSGGGNGYGGVSGDSLTWAGDNGLAPKTEVVTGPSSAAPAGSTASPAVQPATHTGAAPAATQSAVGGTTQFDVPYSDGYDDEFWSQQQEAAEEDGGIEGPIPDLPTAQGLGFSRALEASEYPQASRFVPAATGNYRHSPSPRPITRVVIHITDGGRSINGPISWFQNPAARVSAHYIVGQDGEVVQMVRHNDVAWHASRANGDSIGIEHVANSRGLMPTDDEYSSSANLVRWLCAQFAIPQDRSHILGHNEADPTTKHSGCPTAAWDWDRYMSVVNPPPTSDQQSYSTAPYRTMSEGQSFDINWNEVELIAQPTNWSCWAASAAMIVGWRDRLSLTPDTIADLAGRTTASGLNPSNRADLARAWGLSVEGPQSYTIEGFRRLLENNGPLWVGILTPSGTGHAVVVTGMYSDGAPDGSDSYVRISDPWDRDPGTPGAPGSYLGTHDHGSRYVLTWADFAREYEQRITTGPTGSVNVQILHAGGTGGRTIGIGSQAQAYSLGRADSTSAGSLPASRLQAPSASERTKMKKTAPGSPPELPRPMPPRSCTTSFSPCTRQVVRRRLRGLCSSGLRGGNGGAPGSLIPHSFHTLPSADFGSTARTANTSEQASTLRPTES